MIIATNKQILEANKFVSKNSSKNELKDISIKLVHLWYLTYHKMAKTDNLWVDEHFQKWQLISMQ